MALSLDFILSLGTILTVFSGFSVALSGQNGCADVRDAYQDKGFSTNEVPDFAVSGDHLRICQQSFTCCTADMEEKLSQTSTKDFKDIVFAKSSSSREYFIRRAERFDNFFKELIDRGQLDLRYMFTETYGSLYQQNSEFFDELFENFRRYYHGRDLDLAETMEDFFTELLRRMFVLLNPNYEYTDAFWECVAEHTAELKPFGDVPQKLTLHVKRAFIVARTFVQGLSVGRDVISQVSEVTPSAECQKSLMRMSYCPHCRGLPDTKPCYNLCLNTLKGCLAEQAELDAAWNNYIDAILALVDRLEGPVNIEFVMEPIDIRISEAIMNMQENAITVTTKVFTGCGKPRLKSRLTRRDADTEEATLPAGNVTAGAEDGASTEGAPVGEHEAATGREAAGERPPEGQREAAAGRGADQRAPSTRRQRQRGRDPGRGQGRGRDQDRGPHRTTPADNVPTMEKLVKDVRSNLRETKGFWTLLPYMFCDDVAADVAVENMCWNGHSKGSYTHPPVGNGIANQVDNPEVPMETAPPNFLINKHITSLRTITSRLNGAFNGEDVEWVDTEPYSSGSGSGSGSGDGIEGGNEVGVIGANEVDFTEVEDPIYRPTRKPNSAPSLCVGYATRWLLSVCATTVFAFRLLW
ncbi:glypican-4-like [Acanthaster planci]|uniref:Glypican-4-like n=1 Tax=Acanthaster planci TaxID=133434 RepID=A0A8B7Y636_ACAPL|nr:glypican-4-like [Acanthaster planci]